MCILWFLPLYTVRLYPFFTRTRRVGIHHARASAPGKASTALYIHVVNGSGVGSRPVTRAAGLPEPRTLSRVRFDSAECSPVAVHCRCTAHTYTCGCVAHALETQPTARRAGADTTEARPRRCNEGTSSVHVPAPPPFPHRTLIRTHFTHRHTCHNPSERATHNPAAHTHRSNRLWSRTARDQHSPSQPTVEADERPHEPPPITGWRASAGTARPSRTRARTTSTRRRRRGRASRSRGRRRRRSG